MKKHRFVIIGPGGISAKYAAALKRYPETAELAGVVGRNLDKCRDYAERHGVPVYGTNLEDVVRRADATAAIICTPNALHHQGVLEASRLGLHCLCEKPLHISVELQDEMLRSCRDNRVKLGVSYMRRFIPHIRYVKELIDAGALGRITVIDAMMKHYRAKEYYDSWHGTWELDGGGPFMQQGSHIVDMALWLGGGYREILHARTFRVYHDIETEDHGYALIQYGNGAVGMIEASTSSTGMKKEYIEITGTKGSLTVDYEGIRAFHVPGVELPAELEAADNDELFVKLVGDFIEAVDTGREPFISGESARTATELIMGIYAKAGSPLDIR